MTTKEKYQIDKVKRSVPKWFKKSYQINSQILLAYLKIYFDDNIVALDMLKQKCNNLPTFDSNFAKMIDFTEKNSGKVCDVEDTHSYIEKKMLNQLKNSKKL